jgi:hypothetical protein
VTIAVRILAAPGDIADVLSIGQNEFKVPLQQMSHRFPVHPVASIATCVTPCALKNLLSSSSAEVVVAKVFTSSCTAQTHSEYAQQHCPYERQAPHSADTTLPYSLQDDRYAHATSGETLGIKI